VQPTGVDIVDRVIGGIAPGLPVILAGPSGSGRTVIALQLAAAALDRGDVVAYLCNEPSPFLLRQAASLELGVDFDAAVEMGQLVLLELDPLVANLVRAHGSAALIDAVRAEEPLCSNLVVDPVTALTGEIHDQAALRSTARDLVRSASPMKIVLTAESEQLALQKGLDRILSEVSGAFLSLHRHERNGERWLRVEKTRSGLVGDERARFEIGYLGARYLEWSEGPGSDAAGAEGPRAVAPEPVPAAVDPREEKQRPVVLVVDDDRLSRTMVCKWLEQDYDVVAARDGFEAMTCLAAQRPDVVVLDLIMPRVTGYELLGAFQRVAPDIPLLVASGRVSRAADRIGPLVLGATDILVKPLDRFELVHKVDMLLRLGGPPRRWLDPADAEALFATVSDRRRLDEEGFRLRLDRAHRFGERYGRPASLVAVSGPSAAALDALEVAADANLRFEDALLRVSRRRTLILLVAIEPADAGVVIERLLRDVEAVKHYGSVLETRVHAALPAAEGLDWHQLFRGEEEP